MLRITVPASDVWDETNEEFVKLKEHSLCLEHSLVSLSKWEATWCKSFLHTKDFTYEQFIDYIKCMTITQNVSDDVYLRLTNDNVNRIRDYINAPMTATTFSKTPRGGRNNEIVTSELIYYWMIVHNIPKECEKWHLNRLMTLIQVCNVKNSKPKKMSRKQLMSRNAQLNAARREQFNTNG
jgi:hypothetical protein